MRTPTTHVGDGGGGGGSGGGNAKLAKSLGTAVLEWVSKPLKVL